MKGIVDIMKNKKRWLALGLVGIMTLGCFAGCGSKSDGKSADGKGDSSKGSVYYLNFIFPIDIPEPWSLKDVHPPVLSTPDIASCAAL